MLLSYSHFVKCCLKGVWYHWSTNVMINSTKCHGKKWIFPYLMCLFIHCMILFLSNVNCEHICHRICFAGSEFEIQVILLSRRWKMGLRVAYLIKFLLVVLGLVLYCEFVIYYIVLLQVSYILYAVTFTFLARKCWHYFPFSNLWVRYQHLFLQLEFINGPQSI